MPNQTINKKNNPISTQYDDSKNFMARVELHRKFSTNPHGWTRWIFDQIHFKENSRVLELGCGNALLWKSNLDRIPEDSHIILSDLSSGMLKDARKVLGNSYDRFEYEVLDAQQIPYPDNSIDIIIANLMLYHVPDRKKAISEISRVLMIDGSFYATTFGLENMKELTDLIFSYNNKNYSLKYLANEFGLENGKDQLFKYFEDVKIVEYPDYLEVKEAEPLVNFVLSSSKVIKKEEIADFRTYINDILRNEGRIKITKDSCIFIARNLINPNLRF